jgi:hypothetical protein
VGDLQDVSKSFVSVLWVWFVIKSVDSWTKKKVILDLGDLGLHCHSFSSLRIHGKFLDQGMSLDGMFCCI